MAVRHKYRAPALVCLALLNLTSLLLLDHGQLVPADVQPGQQEQGEGREERCDFPEVTNKTVFSTPEIVRLYTEFRRGCEVQPPLLSALQSRVTEEGALEVTGRAGWGAVPGWTGPDCGAGEDTLLFLVMSGGADRAGRDRHRHQWTQQLPPGDRVAFLLPRFPSAAENAAVAEEAAEFGDLVQTWEGAGAAHLSATQAALALYFSLSQCPGAGHTVLLAESCTDLQPGLLHNFTLQHRYHANRVYGRLERGRGPARQQEAPHRLLPRTWPWPRLPPFLRPELAVYSGDTLARLLHQATTVPLLPVWEVWLTGLVSLAAGVTRAGSTKLHTGSRPPTSSSSGPGQAAVCRASQDNVVRHET